MGHRLSKIYTRTGDDGSTGLGDGRRTDKDSARICCIGSVDEVRNSDIPRVRNLLSRTSEEEQVDADEYLQRLTGRAD